MTACMVALAGAGLAVVSSVVVAVLLGKRRPPPAAERRVRELEQALAARARADGIVKAMHAAFTDGLGNSAFRTLLTLLQGELGGGTALLGRTAEEGATVCIRSDREDEQRIDAEPWPAPWQEAVSRGTACLLGDAGFDAGPARPRALVAPIVSGGKVCGVLAFWEGGRELQPSDAAFVDSIIGEIGAVVGGRLRRQKAEYRKLRAMEEAYRLSEGKLRAILEESRDMIATLDADGRFLDINRAGTGLLGFEGAERVVGRSQAEFWSNPEDHNTFLWQLGEDGYVKDFEVILKRSDGSVVFGLQSATLSRSQDGSVTAIHVTVKDITDRTRSEQALWKSSVELAQANQKLKESQTMLVQQEKLASIGQLAAGVAHEINNPLAFLMSNHSVTLRHVDAIKKFAASLALAAPEAAEKGRAEHDIDYVLEDLETIMREADDGFRRISDIVRNLKSFARADSAEGYAAFDVNKGIEDTLAVARNEVKYVAEVKLGLGPTPPVECIGGQINQVLLNLVVNAAQAIKGQGRSDPGRIEIRTGVAGERVWIEIQDDGPGIAKEVQARIFEPFFTTKPAGQGTGLGLSISSDIITHRHRGSLTVASEPGKGTCFRIELPMRRVAIEGQEAAPPSA